MIAGLVAMFAGAVFGAGVCISGMVRPSKVIAFLDLGGPWDPSLALVLGAGLVVHALAWRLTRPPRTPMFGGTFPAAPIEHIDARLIGGAIVFGVGWGLGGFCPGPSLVSTVSRVPGTLVFVAAMIAGIVLARVVAGADRTSPTRVIGDACS